MRFTVLVIFLFLFPTFITVSFSQNSNLPDSLITRADLFYPVKNYDSPLVYNLKALRWFKENKPDNYQLSRFIEKNFNKSFTKKNNIAHPA